MHSQMHDIPMDAWLAPFAQCLGIVLRSYQKELFDLAPALSDSMYSR